ncbi:hypothetical protein [Actinoplanes subglobosus]|uniref:Lysozyme n=1 Tax=Actinoplanes subglobosus TaxID=1547892 RepID=A0ABV8IYK0_9ACTN
MSATAARIKAATIGALAFTTTLAGLPAAAHAAPRPSSPPPAPQVQASVADPDKALGAGWRKSSDITVTGTGDTDGYHLHIAREKDAFAWSTLATLKSSEMNGAPWGGAVCVTGSGRYAVAVFAPKIAANKPSAMQAGALAAVVDTTTGKAVHVATGVQYSYYNPACGPGDRALLVRGIGGDLDKQRTDLLTVDAAAGRVTSTRRIDAQLSNPVPAPDGDYGIVGGNLVKVAANGRLTTVAKPNGRTFDIRATAGSGIDLISLNGETAVAQRFHGGKLTTTATGPRTNLQLFGLRGGSNALVGQVTLKGGKTPAGLTTLRSDKPVTTISTEGHLLVEEAYSQQTADSLAKPLTAADPTRVGQSAVTVRPAGSEQRSTGVITTTAAPVLDAQATAVSAAPTVAAAPSYITNPKCAVPRNDPTVQPLQPSPDMVEWAVDLAVHEELFVNRPANYLKTGLPAYQPQSMFPMHSLVGGGRVPANLLLAIIAQETNLSQASWHVVPGDTGNPLLPLYYGSHSVDTIYYPDADCGYGVGQVTTGMSVGDTVYTANQRKAIAVDYAANVAASLNILIDKWNQMKNEPSAARSQINDGDAKHIENWFLAVWAYNSGFYTYADRAKNNGRYGVGWLNNPANSIYKPNRLGFLRDSLADAETPNLWSYPERIMGWVETPQLKGSGTAYSEPTFGDNGPTFWRVSWHKPEISWNDGVSLPGLYTFCSPAVNSCSQAQNGCPAVSSACWWNGLATIGNCENLECTTEKRVYSAGDSEPGVKRIYDRNCSELDDYGVNDYDSSRPTAIVYTLNDTGQYNLGCTNVKPQNGRFNLLMGDPSGATDDSYYAAIDLHQVGAGFQGHVWSTYGYSGDRLKKHKIVGQWTPDLGLGPQKRGRYSVLVHIPSHGGTGNAEYHLQPSTRDNDEYVDFKCTINQDEVGEGNYSYDHWMILGNFDLGRGARLWMSNAGVSSSDSVGWDAVAFVPTTVDNGDFCGKYH